MHAWTRVAGLRAGIQEPSSFTKFSDWRYSARVYHAIGCERESSIKGGAITSSADIGKRQDAGIQHAADVSSHDRDRKGAEWLC